MSTTKELIKTIRDCMDSQFIQEFTDATIETLGQAADRLEQLQAEINQLTSVCNTQNAHLSSYRHKLAEAEKELEETQEKLEALLCEATGGKLSKHSYTTEVMTTQAHEHLLKCCADERAEAVKEFAERYERCLLSQLTTAPLDKKEWIYFCLDELDNLKKEMAGEQE